MVIDEVCSSTDWLLMSSSCPTVGAVLTIDCGYQLFLGRKTTTNFVYTMIPFCSCLYNQVFGRIFHGYVIGKKEQHVSDGYLHYSEAHP